MIFLSLLSSMVSAQVTRQPYLQIVTPSSIVVRWDTKIAEVDTVWFGTSETSLTRIKHDTAATTKHEITISGLTAKQKYYYSITGPSSGSSDQYFITAPAPGSAQFTRIWVVADFGQSNSLSDNIRRLKTVDVWKTFNNNDPRADFMLSLGDQTESDTEFELQDNYFNQLQGVLTTTPLYTIAGNREDADREVSYKATFSVPSQGEAGGYPSGTKDYYSFNYGNVHVVGLTAENSVSISGAQKTWLQNDLANNKSDWLIAFMHRPMHSTGFYPTNETSASLSQKANWLPLLEAAGVDLILAGHIHFYERSYLLDNLTGNSASITIANKIDTLLGRIDVQHAYLKELGRPHQGTIFINCEGAGNSSKGTYVPVPNSFFPVVYKGDLNEGSLVIDVDGRNRMDAKFLCDEPNASGSHVWDYFSIVKTQKATSVTRNANLLPMEFSVTNHPNPFNPSTKIRYSLPETDYVNIGIYDVLGRNVLTIADGMKEKGTYTFDWNARDERGNRLPGGVYIFRIHSNQYSGNAKMLLLK